MVFEHGLENTCIFVYLLDSGLDRKHTNWVHRAAALAEGGAEPREENFWRFTFDLPRSHAKMISSQLWWHRQPRGGSWMGVNQNSSVIDVIQCHVARVSHVTSTRHPGVFGCVFGVYLLPA